MLALTWIDWLNGLYWWPVLLIVAGGGLVIAYARSNRRNGLRALVISVGSIAVMAGLATMTLFVWGIVAIWLMLIVGVVLSAIVWFAWAPRRVHGFVAVALTNLFTVALVAVVLINSTGGTPLSG